MSVLTRHMEIKLFQEVFIALLLSSWNAYVKFAFIEKDIIIVRTFSINWLVGHVSLIALVSLVTHVVVGCIAESIVEMAVMVTLEGILVTRVTIDVPRIIDWENIVVRTVPAVHVNWPELWLHFILIGRH